MQPSDASKAWLIAGVAAVLAFAVPHLAYYDGHRMMAKIVNPAEGGGLIGRYSKSPGRHVRDAYFKVDVGPMNPLEPLLVGLGASVFLWFLRKRLNWPWIVTVMIVLGGVHVGWETGWSTADCF